MSELTLAQKQAQIDKVMAAQNARRKKKNPTDDRPAVFYAGSRPDLLNPGVVKSKNLAMNTYLNGGYKRGTMHVLWGQSGAGKTVEGLQAIAEEQSNGGTALYALSEGKFPVADAVMVGVDLDKLIIIEGFATAEEAIDGIMEFLVDKETLLPRNIIDIVVVDSVAMLVPKAEMDKTLEDGMESQSMGLHARLMSKATRDINPFLGKCALIFINQERMEINSYGGSRSQPGGNAMKFNPKVVIHFAAPKSGLIYEGTGINKKCVGHTVKLHMDKNNAGLGAFPHSETEFIVRYGDGVDNILPLFNACLIYGVILEVSKSYYQIDLPKEFLAPLGLWKSDGKVDEPLKIHGQDLVISAIKTSESLKDALENMVYGEVDSVDPAVAEVTEVAA